MPKSPTECGTVEELEESVWSVVRQENEREDHGESVQNSGKTNTGVRGRDMGVGEITKKVQERRLKWYGHVMRREEHCVGRRAMVMKVQGRIFMEERKT